MAYFKKEPSNCNISPSRNSRLGNTRMVENEQAKSLFNRPDRGIRSLAEHGLLIKVAKGIYRYDPDLVSQKRTGRFYSRPKKKK